MRELKQMGVEFSFGSSGALLARFSVRPLFLDQIRDGQRQDPHLEEVRQRVLKGEFPEFSVRDDGMLLYGRRMCVPVDMVLKKGILDEPHCSAYALHPGSTKLYRDLREHFWWSGMKREIAEYVAGCETCQRVKAEHQRPAGLLQSLPIPEWKWEHANVKHTHL